MTMRKGFTLMELSMVVVVVAIVVVAAQRDNGAEQRQEAGLASQTMESDVAYVRSLNIARPDDPVILKLDLTTNKYWVAKAATPDTPIANPQTGKDYVVQYGALGKSSLRQVQLYAFDLGGSAVLAFDGMGNTTQSAPALVQLTAGNVQAEVAVSPSAGKTVTQTTFSKTITGIGAAMSTAIDALQ